MAGKVHVYEGQSVRVTYDARRCIHAADCVHGLPAVFDPDNRPWVDPDAASADEVAEVVARCPTGALHLTRRDGAAAEGAPAENTVSIEADGPLYARGDLEVVDAEGSVVLRDTRVALCRCGASKNKPFCDGSHTEAGFRDPALIPDPKLREGESASGGLQITLAKDGPLILDGPVTVAGAGDRCQGGRGALCRCGASENKPFCDGTHARIGFRG